MKSNGNSLIIQWINITLSVYNFLFICFSLPSVGTRKFFCCLWSSLRSLLRCNTNTRFILQTIIANTVSLIVGCNWLLKVRAEESQMTYLYTGNMVAIPHTPYFVVLLLKWNQLILHLILYYYWATHQAILCLILQVL